MSSIEQPPTEPTSLAAFDPPKVVPKFANGLNGAQHLSIFLVVSNCTTSLAAPPELSKAATPPEAFPLLSSLFSEPPPPSLHPPSFLPLPADQSHSWEGGDHRPPPAIVRGTL